MTFQSIVFQNWCYNQRYDFIEIPTNRYHHNFFKLHHISSTITHFYMFSQVRAGCSLDIQDIAYNVHINHLH